MKKNSNHYLLLLFVLLFGVCDVSGQGWVQSYNNIQVGNWGFVSCEPTFDGGYIFLSDRASNARVIKTDAAGNIQWDTLTPLACTSTVTDIFQSQDGGYVVAAGDDNYCGSNNKLFKLNASGGLVWQNISGINIHKLLELSDGSIIGYGDTAIHNVRLVKYDALGNQLWSVPHHTTANTALDIKQTPDGGFITVSFKYDSVVVAKLDANGGMQWDHRFGLDFYYYRKADVLVTNDGNYLVSTIDPGWGRLHLYKYDTQGNLLWIRIIGGEWDHFREIINAHDDGYIAVGRTNRNHPSSPPWGDDPQAYMVKIVADGTYREWERIYDDTVSLHGNFLSSVRKTNDGGYVAGGATGHWNYSFKGYALKVDSMGSLGVPCGDTTYLTTEICHGETFTVGSSTYTQSGTYQDRFVTINACDSIVVTNLTVLEAADSVMVRKICEGESIFLGTTTWLHYYQTGTYVEHRTAANGCDSTITLHLTVYPNYHDTINATICDGETFNVGTYTHTTAGTYDDYFFAQGVCDSIITVNLTVLQSIDTTIYATICEGDSFTVGTNTYFDSGIYEHHFPTSNACDSIVTLDLAVLDAADSVMVRTICEGEYIFLGTLWHYYDETGTYVEHRTAANGCDSTITLHLTVYPNYHDTINVTICDGETFSVGTYTHTTAGTYDDYFFAQGVCDSIITVNLTIGHGEDTEGNPLVQITGTVYENSGGSCVFNSGDSPLANWVVEAESGGNAIYTTTDSSGQYSFLVPYGTYNVSAQTPANWTHCGPASQTVTADGSSCSMQVDIGLVPDYDCALLDIDLSIICLVPCSTSTYHLNYHNIGTNTAYNPTLVFAAGPYITVNWSSVPWQTPQSGNLYQFQLDSVPAGASGWIAIAVTADCDPNLIGYSVCSGGIHNASQCCTTYDQYGGAQIELEAFCVNNDSIEFRIRNTGLGDMLNDLDYFILQDDIVYAIDQFNLGVSETEFIRLNADGRTYRLEAEQEPIHPYLPAPAISVEGCGGAVQGMVSLGYSDILENGDQIPSIDFTCTEITQDCNCNQMYGSPLGVGEQHYITANEQLEYIVRFQNQGAGNVQNILITDTLPNELDPMSIIIGEASHEFTFTVKDGGVVVWQLNDINLASGTPGTIENSGFVKFTADLKPGLQKGTVITNIANMYFDGQQVATNEVFHTIGERFVDFLIPLSIDDIEDPEHILTVFPNPFNESTTLEIIGVDAMQIYIEIYDLEGRLVQRNVANNQIIQIYRNSMADGMYTYKVMADGEFIGTGKLVVGGNK